MYVQGKHYASFAKVCAAFNIPRQQSLRKYKTETFKSQDEVDGFFERQKAFYHSDEYLKEQETKAKFKDKRAQPIRYRGILFRSKALLAKELGCRSNPFKARLATLEAYGFEINDSLIEACTQPLSRNRAGIRYAWTDTVEALNAKFLTRLPDNENDPLYASSQSPLRMPLTTIANLFNVSYETLKRQVYDIKLNGTASITDIFAALRSMQPRGVVFRYKDKPYFSVLQYMQDQNYKLTIQNTQKMLSHLAITIEAGKKKS